MKESQPYNLYNTASSANYYKYRNPSLHSFYTSNPFSNLCHASPRNSRKQSPARLRIFHSAETTDKFHVYIDGVPISKTLPYKEENQYRFIPPGKHQITLCSSGDINETILKKEITLAPNRYYTLVTTANAQDTGMIAFEDQPTVPVGEAKVRFLNLSSEAREIDIAVKNRDVIFSNIHSGNGTTYLGITPMSLELEARKTGTKEVVLHLPLLRFEPNTAYTVLILENDVILLPEYL